MTVGRALAIAIGCAVLAAGCGRSAAVRVAVPPGARVVDMKDIQFAPRDITVPAGTQVLWVNQDQLAHTVTRSGGAGPAFNSGPIAAGGTYLQTFNQPGTVQYLCTLHPGQQGTVTVTPPPR